MQLHSTQAVTPSSNPAHSIFIPSITSPSSPQPTLRNHISRCRRYLRNLQPKTQMLLRNSIAQKDRLRAGLLQQVKSILDTLDDLIKGFSESCPRQSKNYLWLFRSQQFSFHCLKWTFYNFYKSLKFNSYFLLQSNPLIFSTMCFGDTKSQFDGWWLLYPKTHSCN